MQQLALILAVCNNKNNNIKIYLQCYRVYQTNISFTRQSSKTRKIAQIHTSKFIHLQKISTKEKNVKFSMIREILSQVMIQMNVSNINI